MAEVDLASVALSGDRRGTLEALRQKLAAAIDEGPPARDLAALSRQLTLVVEALDSDKPAEGKSAVDQLAARRAARRSRTSGAQPS